MDLFYAFRGIGCENGKAGNRSAAFSYVQTGKIAAFTWTKHMGSYEMADYFVKVACYNGIIFDNKPIELELQISM